MFWAVSCDLVGIVREAVPVSETAIVPLVKQVSREIKWQACDLSFQADGSLASVMCRFQYNDAWVWMCKGWVLHVACGEQP